MVDPQSRVRHQQRNRYHEREPDGVGRRNLQRHYHSSRFRIDQLSAANSRVLDAQRHCRQHGNSGPEYQQRIGFGRIQGVSGTGSGTYGAPLTTLPKTTTSYTATGLQTGTTYFFVITAYDSSGNESTFSTEVSKSIFSSEFLQGKKCGRARTLRTFTRSGNHPLHTTAFPISASPPYSVTNLKPTAGLTPRLHRLYKGRVCSRFPSIEDLA